MLAKVLNPKVYVRKIHYLLARLVFFVGGELRVTTKCDGFTIFFLAGSFKEYVLRARESYRREKVTMHWLRKVIGKDDVVYDIGANVGAYSLYAGRKLSSGRGQVYAFEPGFPNFFPLCKNIELNNLNGKVVPYAVAVGSRNGVGHFFLRSTIRGDALHGLSAPESEGREFEPKFLEGTSIVSLDEFIQEKGVLFPNHVKIDVDGSELEIIDGMNEVLADPRLKSIMIEINADVTGEEIEAKIESHGLVEVMVEQWGGRNTFNKLFERK